MFLLNYIWMGFRAEFLSMLLYLFNIYFKIVKTITFVLYQQICFKRSLVVWFLYWLKWTRFYSKCLKWPKVKVLYSDKTTWLRINTWVKCVYLLFTYSTLYSHNAYVYILPIAVKLFNLKSFKSREIQLQLDGIRRCIFRRGTLVNTNTFHTYCWSLSYHNQDLIH